MKRLVYWKKNNPSLIEMKQVLNNEKNKNNEIKQLNKKKTKQYHHQPFSTETKIIKKRKKINYTWGV